MASSISTSSSPPTSEYSSIKSRFARAEAERAREVGMRREGGVKGQSRLGGDAARRVAEARFTVTSGLVVWFFGGVL